MAKETLNLKAVVASIFRWRLSVLNRESAHLSQT
jgi:hypothetical protein